MHSGSEDVAVVFPVTVHKPPIDRQTNKICFEAMSAIFGEVTDLTDCLLSTHHLLYPLMIQQNARVYDLLHADLFNILQQF